MGTATAYQAPRVQPARGWSGVAAPAVLAGAVMAGTLALHLRDPHETGSWGVCPSLALTGLYCPLCGGLRSVNDLSNGQVGAAFASNALFVTSIPLLVLAWLRSVRQGWRGVRSPLPAGTVRVVAWAAVVVTVAFTVARNLPFGAWLAP